MLSTQIKSEKNQEQVNVGGDEGDAHGSKRGVISSEGGIQRQCLAGLPTWDQTATGAQGLAVLRNSTKSTLTEQTAGFSRGFSKLLIQKSTKNPPEIRLPNRALGTFGNLLFNQTAKFPAGTKSVVNYNNDRVLFYIQNAKYLTAVVRSFCSLIS